MNETGTYVSPASSDQWLAWVQEVNLRERAGLRRRAVRALQVSHSMDGERRAAPSTALKRDPPV